MSEVKIKLSEKQKEVIIKMRGEWELKQNTVSSDSGYLLYDGRFTSSLRATIVRALIDRKLLEHKRHGFPFDYFSLTDLGKSIKL
jgi:hypothetical protein